MKKEDGTYQQERRAGCQAGWQGRASQAVDTVASSGTPWALPCDLRACARSDRSAIRSLRT